MLDRLRRGRSDDPTAALERRLGVRFRDRSLLERALTHSSYANEKGLPADNERLEFLGDAVLGLLASEWLFAAEPELAEGPLTAGRSGLVSGPTLARFAEEIELGAALRLGVGEERSGGRVKESLLAATFEAVLGALYLDRGLEAARRLAQRLFESAADAEEAELPADAKSRLQERVQARGGELPVYRLLEESGPDHDKRFRVECRVGDQSAVGEGRTKKRAETRAAAELLARLP